MRKPLFFLVILLSTTVGWIFGSWFESRKIQPVDRATLPADMDLGGPGLTIHAQGKLRPAAGVINIFAPLGERIDGLTDKQVGDVLQAGEIVATLRSRVLREKDLELAKARRADAFQNRDFEKRQAEFKLKSAQLAVKEAEASEEKISEQAKSIELLKQQRDVAQKMLQRLEGLRSNAATRSLVNQSEVEKQNLLVEQLRLQIEQAELDVELARKSSRRAVEVAQNNLQTLEFSIANADQAIPEKSLDAAVALAQQAFDLTLIRAPIDNATLLELLVHEGDTATNRPIMVMADLSQMNCEAEVIDELLKSLDATKQGNLRARVTSNALPEPLMGSVVAKGVMIGPVSLQDPNPFAKVDQRMGTVTVRLDDSKLASEFVNLQVDVEIEVEPGTLEK